MLMLAITTDDKLVKKLGTVGQVLKCTTADIAKDMIKSGEFDTVVVGEPYTNINTQVLLHENIVVINTPEDLNRLIKPKSKQRIFDEFTDSLEDTVKPIRKLRPVEPDPEVVQVNTKELGKVLLVTTNMELVKYLLEFDLRIATTVFSAKKALEERPQIIVWDLAVNPIEPPNVLLYRWGTDIRHKEDVLQVLENVDL